MILLQKQINIKLEALREEYSQYVAVRDAIIAKFESEKEAINALDVPEQSDIIKTLEEYNGKKCEVVYGSQNYTDIVAFDTLDLMVKIGKDSRLPFIGHNSAITSITDLETGKLIYKNPYTDYSRNMQIALIFGKSVAMENIQEDIDELNSYKERAKQNLKKAENFLTLDATALYENGLQYIYPQRKKEWRGLVISYCSSIREIQPIEDALKIIKDLHEGKAFSEIDLKDYIRKDEYRNEVLDLVTTFSKKGVEFAMQCNPDYIDYLQRLENDSSDEIALEAVNRYKSFFNNIAYENKNFENISEMGDD